MLFLLASCFHMFHFFIFMFSSLQRIFAVISRFFFNTSLVVFYVINFYLVVLLLFCKVSSYSLQLFFSQFTPLFTSLSHLLWPIFLSPFPVHISKKHHTCSSLQHSVTFYHFFLFYFIKISLLSFSEFFLLCLCMLFRLGCPYQGLWEFPVFTSPAPAFHFSSFSLFVLITSSLISFGCFLIS